MTARLTRFASNPSSPDGVKMSSTCTESPPLFVRRSRVTARPAEVVCDTASGTMNDRAATSSDVARPPLTEIRSLSCTRSRADAPSFVRTVKYV